MGQKSFYGPGKTVDTTQKFTVVTQFITDTGNAEGDLSQIRRIYVQNGKVIQNAVSKVPGISNTNAISTDFCDQQFAATNSTNGFEAVGGFTPLNTAFETGMVLAISLWDDPGTFGMSWLDGAPNAGTCTTGVVATTPTVNATFSNIKFGDIGSTFGW
jgi:cellulose 1,4-beta-cellobiosidase